MSVQDQNKPVLEIVKTKHREDQIQQSCISTEDFKRAKNIKLLISDLLENRQTLKYDNLNYLQEWGYSIGHFMNDITGACWFNYMLYWFKEVLIFKYAPFAMLSGQVCDAIATPLVGYFSDKQTSRFGKRTVWYLGGTVLVIIGFLPVFNTFLPGKIWVSLNDSEDFKTFYYIFFPSLYSIGWAAVQISHMSLIPSLTVSRKKRDRLNNKRNTFTFVANLSVLSIALILFEILQDSMEDFEILGCIVVGIGSITSALFLMSIDEPKLTRECEKQTEIIREILAACPSNEKEESDAKVQQQNSSSFTTWREWMSSRQFYHYAFVYMGCRLYCNVISTMLNFFMVYVLKIATQQEIAHKTPIEIALIPLLLFISSVIMSSSLDSLYELIGKRKTFSIGGIFMVLTSISLAFIGPETHYFMYPIALIIGCAQVLMLNTSITLISDVIGLRGESGAFVFGAYSFVDKLSTGIALFSISESQFFTSESFVRWVTVLVPFFASLLAWILILSGNIHDSYSDEENSSNEHLQVDEEQENQKQAKNKQQYGIKQEGECSQNNTSSSSSQSLFTGQDRKKQSEQLQHLIKEIKNEFAS